MSASERLPEWATLRLFIARKNVRRDAQLYAESHTDEALMVLLADRVAELEGENARLTKWMGDHEEAEASVCPEGVGLVEHVRALTARVSKAERLLADALPGRLATSGLLCNASTLDRYRLHDEAVTELRREIEGFEP